ncbi:MAG: acetate--CoA ligase family protein, partial [Deltaproteobacteria bacterium]|nr:acetate--CoA ligase family protein [Deltaproteobacteria bacterium]
GFELPPAVLAATPDQAAQAAAEMDRPVACKIVCPDIVHKSDAGGVKLNLPTPEQAASAVREILAKAEQVAAKEKIAGCLVSPMAEAGQEVILGLVRDGQFGPVVMFGLGGIFVEVLKDVAFGVCPLTEADIERMIFSIKGYPALTGVRGQPPKDIEAIKVMIAKLSIIALENPEIAEIDLNPVIVHERGASVVDSRLILTE